MRKLTKKIDIFCYKHPNFGLNRLMLWYVILSALAFLVQMMDTTGMFKYYICFSPTLIFKGQVWRLFTWIFTPTQTSNVFFTAIELFFYYSIGSTLESVWGKARFNIYYLTGIVLNLVYGFITYIIFGHDIYITAEYLNLSMFFTFALLFPNQRVLLFFIIPVKIKWLAIVDALLFAYFIIVNSVNISVLYGILPIIAIFNTLLFCWTILFRKRVKQERPKKVYYPDFNNEEKKYAKAAQYRYKCSVCGITDMDNPNMEFRYCSKCSGYHCFCINHINSHIHFTEEEGQ